MNFIKNIISLPVFIIGYIFFKFTNIYSEKIYQSYVRAYCLTNGKISKLISNIKSLNWKKNHNPSDEIINSLNNNGYTCIENFLDNDEINDLISFSKNNKCAYMQENNINFVYFDKNKCSKPTYFYKKKDMLDDQKVIKIIKKINHLKIAEKYFLHKPYLVDVNMWWSTKSNITDPKSAQEFHFDLDGLKWLKFFIYLDDVDKDHGPHVFIKGTHKYKHKEIINKGYKRINNEIINRYYKNKIVKIYKKKGTLIIGDTSCFHKGEKPVTKERLIFECTFSNDLFGNKEISNLNNYLL